MLFGHWLASAWSREDVKPQNVTRLVRGRSNAVYWFTLKHRLCVLLDPYRGPKRVRVNAVCKRLFLGQVCAYPRLYRQPLPSWSLDGFDTCNAQQSYVLYGNFAYVCAYRMESALA